MLSTRCISALEVLQDQRQLPIPLGWSLHCRQRALLGKKVGSWTKRRRSGSRIRLPFWPTAPSAASWSTAARSSNWCRRPRARDADTTVFDAGRHVVLPGLINTHHHFYQTLTRALPARARPRAVSLAAGALSGLGAADAGVACTSRVTRGDGRNCCCPAAPPRPTITTCSRTGLEDAVDIEVEAARRLGIRVTADARLDEPVAEGRRPAARQRGAGRGHDPGRQRAV